jgi:phosphotransferase system HPr-like phosphotransfer protein
MSQTKIRFNVAEDVHEFVRAASKCDFDIDISYNRFLIDAKSLVGVLSMDLSKVLTVCCHGESEEFDRTLNKFAVA